MQTKKRKTQPKAEHSQSPAKAVAQSFLLIVLSNIIRAVAINYFVLPNDFAPGGFSGIASMLYYVTGINAGYFLLALNIPLVILSFFFFNKDYAIKTAVGLALGSGFLIVLEYLDKWLLEDFGFDLVARLSVGNQTILAAIAAGVLSGIALAMVIKSGGSNGGTEVVSGILQKKFPSVNMSIFISILDSSVIVVSFFVYRNGLSAVLLALVQVFCYSKVCDVILSGMKTATKIEVVTASPDALGNEIIGLLGRGVTVVNAMGLYSRQQRSLLICIVRKRQLPEFNKILKRYPDAFAYVTSTNEVIGRGFSYPMVGGEAQRVLPSHYAHPSIKEGYAVSLADPLEPGQTAEARPAEHIVLQPAKLHSKKPQNKKKP